MALALNSTDAFSCPGSETDGIDYPPDARTFMARLKKAARFVCKSDKEAANIFVASANEAAENQQLSEAERSLPFAG